MAVNFVSLEEYTCRYEFCLLYEEHTREILKIVVTLRKLDDRTNPLIYHKVLPSLRWLYPNTKHLVCNELWDDLCLQRHKFKVMTPKESFCVEKTVCLAFPYREE
jgi:hypothetical protein